MSYSISEVAKFMGVAPSTIRYYDKEGLLPSVHRKNGIRVFEKEDLSWLQTLNCLKNIGMPIRQIKEYVKLAQEGDATLKERYELIKKQRISILDQIEQLNYYMRELDFKDWYYKTALKNGSESAVNIDDYTGERCVFEIEEI